MAYIHVLFRNLPFLTRISKQLPKNFSLCTYMNLSIRHKIFLVAVLPALALIGFAGFAIMQSLGVMNRANEIAILAKVSRSAGLAADALERETAFACGAVSSHGRHFQSDFQKETLETDKAFASFFQIQEEIAGAGIGDIISPVKEEVRGLEALRSEVVSARQASIDIRKSYEKRIAVFVSIIRSSSRIAAQEPSLAMPFAALLNRVEHKRRSASAQALMTASLAAQTISGSELKEFYELRSEEGVFERESATLMDSTVAFAKDAGTIHLADIQKTKQERENLTNEILAQSDSDSTSISPEKWIYTTSAYLLALANSEQVLADIVLRQTESIREKSSDSLRLIGGLSVGVLVLLVIVSLLIIRSITRPLAGLVRHANRIAAGDFSSIEATSSRDEVGTLAATFNSMTARIRTSLDEVRTSQRETDAAKNDAIRAYNAAEQQATELRQHIEQMLRAMERFATGDLTAMVALPTVKSLAASSMQQSLSTSQEPSDTAPSDIERLFRGYNQSLASIHAVVQRMGNAVHGAARVGDEILQQTEGLARGTNHQTEQALEVASAVEELSKTIAENTRQTSLAAEEARQAGGEARSGGVVITSTIQSMSDIGKMVVTLATTIERLGESSNHISNVIELIYGIADQTNLLALNAAIEAARAGEAGRGFAVVADEVRKLAERTQSATKEIGQTIERIRTDTTHAVGIAREGAQEAERSAGAAAQSSSALERIIERTSTVSDIIAGLSVAGEQQTEVAEDIARRMTSITHITQNSAQAAQHIAATVHEMDALMVNVQELVQGFVLEEGATRLT